jgi:hypothetical protein
MFIDLLSFLNRVSQHSEVNFMTPKNLAVCWTPTLVNSDEKKGAVINAAAILNEKYAKFFCFGGDVRRPGGRVAREDEGGGKAEGRRREGWREGWRERWRER